MRPHQIALLALASTALLFACGDDDDDNTPVTVDLNGTWSFTVDVTVANGVCAGEEDNPVTPFPVEVSITDANADGIWDITASGFVDNPDASVSGTFAGEPQIGDDLELTGSYPEDGGTTTATYHLTLDTATRLTGSEAWTWTGAGGTCEGGESTVVATAT